jgi:hypothetical protein
VHVAVYGFQASQFSLTFTTNNSAGEGGRAICAAGRCKGAR